MGSWQHDGYDWSVMVDGTLIGFRPVPDHIRQQQTAWLLTDPSLDLFRELIQQRLVSGVIPESAWENAEQAAALWEVVSGHAARDELRREMKNLRECAGLMLTHPHLCVTSCEQCREWFYDIEKGTVARWDGRPLRREGPTACEGFAACPIGHYSNQKRLSERNMLAIRHYRECLATGCFPDDPIVRQNAVIIKGAWARCRKRPQTT